MLKLRTQSIFNTFILTNYVEYIPKEIIELIIMATYPHLSIIGGVCTTYLLMDGIVHAWGRDDDLITKILNSERDIGDIASWQYHRSKKIIHISRGHNHIAFITTNNEAYIWGGNKCGQLGLNNYDSQNSPQKLNLIATKMIICSIYSTVALTKLNKVYVWGLEKGCFPHEVNLPDIISISHCNGSIFALAKSGDIYAWGPNCYGHLGLGNCDYQSLPQKIDLPDIIEIACGLQHSIVLNKFGDVYSWGSNWSCQLGLGEGPDRGKLFPQKINLENIEKIFSGNYSSFAISKSGHIYAWGLNNYGQLGLGNIQNQNSPQKLDLDNIKTIFCGGDHTFAITKYDEIYSWGWNKYGQLGLDNNTDQWVPQRVNF